MRNRTFRHRYLSWLLATCVGGGGGLAVLAGPPAPAPQEIASASADRGAKPGDLGKEKKEEKDAESPNGGSICKPVSAVLGVEMVPIDLDSALKLGGVSNPQILLARQRIVEAVAQRQLAAAQFLPALNLGLSYDDHAGNLQQSNGNILKVDRNSMYLGAGAHAIAAGSVSIPGVYWNLNPAVGVYGFLIAQQVVEVRQLASRAVDLEMLLRIAVTYNELQRAEGQYAIALRVLEDAREVEELSVAFARAGRGSEADADRARTERQQREAEVPVAEGQMLIVSARLTELLNLPPTMRLVALDRCVVPAPVVPDPIPLPELLAIALLNRPELQEYQAIIRQTLLALQQAKVLPFSPWVIIGLSYGGEGGGSNLITADPSTTNAQQGVFTPPGTANFAASQPRFGNFHERLDFDAIAFWSLQNLALGNKAQILLAQAQVGSAQFRFLEQLNTVRAQVADAYARTHARFAQIGTAEQSVREVMTTFESDKKAVHGGEGKPIELLQSLRLLARGRYAYLNAIADYNRAQLELYVSLGKPPPNVLARPVPPGAVPPAVEQEDEKKKEQGEKDK
jgi:outer membrane protein TolC